MKCRKLSPNRKPTPRRLRLRWPYPVRRARRKQEGRPARRRPQNKAKAETGEKPAETRGERHRKPKRKSDERGERPAKSTRPDSGYREPRKPRDREPDPDSPFAALAVLKERVGGN